MKTKEIAVVAGNPRLVRAKLQRVRIDRAGGRGRGKRARLRQPDLIQHMGHGDCGVLLVHALLEESTQVNADNGACAEIHDGPTGRSTSGSSVMIEQESGLPDIVRPPGLADHRRSRVVGRPEHRLKQRRRARVLGGITDNGDLSIRGAGVRWWGAEGRWWRQRTARIDSGDATRGIVTGVIDSPPMNLAKLDAGTGIGRI